MTIKDAKTAKTPTAKPAAAKTPTAKPAAAKPAAKVVKEVASIFERALDAPLVGLHTFNQVGHSKFASKLVHPEDYAEVQEQALGLVEELMEHFELKYSKSVVLSTAKAFYTNDEKAKEAVVNMALDLTDLVQERGIISDGRVHRYLENCVAAGGSLVLMQAMVEYYVDGEMEEGFNAEYLGKEDGMLASLKLAQSAIKKRRA